MPIHGDQPSPLERLTALLPRPVLDAVRIVFGRDLTDEELELASAVAVATYTATIDYALNALTESIGEQWRAAGTERPQMPTDDQWSSAPPCNCSGQQTHPYSPQYCSPLGR